MLRCLTAVVALLLSVASCGKAAQESNKAQDRSPEAEARRERARVREAADDQYKVERERMVTRTIEDRGVKDPRVLEAMRSVRRHELVPPEIRDQAYDDRALPIGFGLTISQPYIVALMTEAAKLRAGDRVLEIGTGSGYQAAVLAELANKVYTIEIHEQLAERTRKTLAAAGYSEIQLRIGDGYKGWPEAGPFDAIFITCATPEIPAPLLAQLADGGRLVAPVGDDDQVLRVYTKGPNGLTTEDLADVRFGPMLGEVRSDRQLQR